MKDKGVLCKRLEKVIEEWHLEDPDNRPVRISLTSFEDITKLYVEEITREIPTSGNPWKARGTRIDDLADGSYLMLHFGLFSTGEASKEFRVCKKDALNFYNQLKTIFEEVPANADVDTAEAASK